jgi:short-subunit dehydrogenase
VKSAILISGATGYAGSQIARHLAAQGENLLLSARDEVKIQSLISELGSSQPGQFFHSIPCDLSNEEAWRISASSLDDYEINGFINCAGIQGTLGINSLLDTEDMSQVFAVNLFSGIFFSNYLVNKKLQKSKLKIIHFSGGGSTSPRPRFMAYSLSKTALVRFVENFSLEHEDSSIQINAIAPGVLPSRMQQEVLDNPQMINSKDFLIAEKSMADRTPLNKRVISLCDFLLSERSQGISGKLISADWDNWEEWPSHIESLHNSDLYTLRRVTGRDKGHSWGDL